VSMQRKAIVSTDWRSARRPVRAATFDPSRNLSCARCSARRSDSPKPTIRCTRSVPSASEASCARYFTRCASAGRATCDRICVVATASSSNVFRNRRASLLSRHPTLCASQCRATTVQQHRVAPRQRKRYSNEPLRRRLTGGRSRAPHKGSLASTRAASPSRFALPVPRAASARITQSATAARRSSIR
jgi:hypothetical protein